MTLIRSKPEIMLPAIDNCFFIIAEYHSKETESISVKLSDFLKALDSLCLVYYNTKKLFGRTA